MSTPIVMDMFWYTNYVFVSFRIVKCMTRLVMVLVPRTSNEESFQVCVLYAIGRPFVRDFRVICLCSFRVNICRC